MADKMVMRHFLALMLLAWPISAMGDTATKVTIDTRVRIPKIGENALQSLRPEAFCEQAINGQVPGISFKYFDHRWRDPEWEAAKARVVAKCQAWNQNKQDSQAISSFVEERNRFAQLSISARNNMVDTTIRLLGPARNQGEVGFCLGFTLADAITYLTGKRPSAFSVVVRGFQNIGGVDAFRAGLSNSTGRYSNGAYFLPTAKAILRSSICAEDQKPQRLSYSDDDLKQLWSIYENKYRPYFGPQAPVELYSRLQGHLSRIAPGLSSSNFIQQINRAKPLDTALGEWFDRQCRIKMPGGVQLVEGLPATTRSVDEALEAGSMALIGYNNSFIMNGRGGGHASSIVGSATIEGAKYYLLRNSYGEECVAYPDLIEARCREGHLWVTEQELASSLRLVYYFKAQR